MKRKKLPSSGRIKADQSKLVPTNSYGIPLYYEDVEFNCVDCKKRTIFTKEEQRAWYEHYGIPHYAHRLRCSLCDKEHSERENVRERYQKLAILVHTGNADANVLGEFGILAFQLYEAFHSNRLEDAVSALKRSLQVNPRMVESNYWLGRCYEALGLAEKSHIAFTEFLQKRHRKKGGSKVMIKDTEKRIAALAIRGT